jgi:proline iminopeptidase
MEFHEKIVRAINLNIFVKTVGSGKPLVFLHGGPGGDHQYFLPHVQPLAKSHQLFFYDQRGCGRSEEPSDGTNYTMAEEVDTLEELRQGLGLEKINIIGESWGSMLALLYAVKYPENVEKILLTAAIGADMTGLTIFEEELANRLSKEDRVQFDQVKERMEKGETTVKELIKIITPYYVFFNETLSRMSKSTGNPTVNKMLMEDITKNYDIKNELTKLLDIPILVVQGDSDMIKPSMLNDLLLKYIPHAKIELLENCGHWTLVEQTDKFNSIAESFFQN